MLQVSVHEPSWLDRKWTKAIKKLPKREAQQLEGSLVALIEALKESSHPILDPRLNRWSPSRYHGRSRANVAWCEYRLGDRRNRARAIVAFDSSENTIYLFARTAIHDHRRVGELIKRYGPEISGGPS